MMDNFSEDIIHSSVNLITILITAPEAMNCQHFAAVVLRLPILSISDNKLDKIIF